MTPRGAPGSHPAICPTQHAPVTVGHDAVERARVGIEHERQEVTVAFPQRQLSHLLDFDPLEPAFRIALERYAAEARNDEQEPEPVLATFAESRPADRTAQAQVEAVDSRLLADFPAHTRRGVLVGF